MAVLLVTYELRDQLKDYSPLFKAIQNNSTSWWHYLERVWLVDTTHNPDTFAKLLYPYITTGDALLVFKLARENQGWLPNEAWKWINERKY